YVPADPEREIAMEMIDLFKPALESPTIQKVGQNIKYDVLLLARYGVKVAGKFFDTMLAHYLLEPDSRHNMDLIAETYLNYSPVPITELIGPKGKKQGNMRDLPAESIKEYAGEDADITWQMKEKLRPLLQETGTLSLAEQVEFPLIKVLAEVEKNGVMVNVETLQQFSKEIETDLRLIEQQIYEKAGVTFN